MKNIKIVLFDLDGTLINSPEMIMSAFEKTVIDHIPNYQLSKHERTNVLGQTLDKAFDKFAKTADDLNKMIDSYKYYTSNDTFDLKGYEGLKEVLSSLKENNVLLGIVTSKTDYVVFDNLKDLDIKHYFDVIVTYQDTIKHKPNPDPILLAIEKLGGKREETIYIGDHENDIIAGKNALVKTGLMAYSYRFNEAMLEKPDFVYEDLKNIIIKMKEE